MGSFDCYCALCAGPLNIFAVKRGIETKMALKLRSERLELKKRKLAGETGIDENEPYDALKDSEMEDVGDDDEEEDAMEQDEPKSSDDEDDHDYSDTGSSDSDSDSDISDDSIAYSFNSDDSDLHLATIPDVAVPPSPPPVPSTGAWSEDNELQHTDDYTGREGAEPKLDAWYEQDSYDPTKVTPDQVRWLARCRALGFNPNARGTTKAFYTGRGSYNDYGGFDVDVQGKDPNDPGDGNFTCFYAYDANELPVFPFHEECYKILSRSLGHVDPLKVDKDLMYNAMKQHGEDYNRCLNLDFGLEQEEGQFWECWPGEEACVIDPSYDPTHVGVLQDMLPAVLFDDTSLPELDSKVRNEPLTALPYDVLHDIVDYLSDKDMLSLMKASWHVNKVTRDNAFWRRMLTIRVHPWLWELESFFEDLTLPEHFNYKRFFIWLMTATRFEFGVFGPLSGIGNRRRIWKACQEVVESYCDQLRLRGVDELVEDETKEEAQDIFKSAVSLHTPMVMYPEPKESRPVTTLFLRSWKELTQTPSYLKTYWNENGNLVGIVLEVGSSHRKFGSTEGNEGQTLHIGAGDWIRRITLKVRGIDLTDPLTDRSAFSNPMYVRPAGDCAIQGMTVELKSGKTKNLRDGNWKATNVREFRVLDDLHLVGLTGYIASNGIISRLGLLQAPHPSSYMESTDHLGYSDLEKRLWTGLACAMRYDAKTCLPIWRHPVYKHHSLRDMISPNNRDTDIPADMLPHEVLLWAEVPEIYEYVTSIKCLQVIEGQATDCTNWWDTAAMLGFIPGKGPHGIPNNIGTMGPVPSQHPNWSNMKTWEELDLNNQAKWQPRDPRYLKEFTIDGKGGEIITEVHLSNDAKNLRLVTNRGRSCFWGEERPNPPSEDQWHIKRAQSGEVIVGITGCFGKLGGWNSTVKMHSHWRLSDLGVITCAPDAKI